MSAEVATPVAPVRSPHSLRALTWKLGLLLSPLLIVIGLLILRQTQVARLAGHQLPKLSKVPSFTLTDQDGHSFGSAQLTGKIWLADFIYTTCPGPCPMISSRLSETQKPLRETNVQLVSFSVDPAHDTPEVLRTYATTLHAEAGRWHFLTGDKKVIYQLSRDGFKLAAEKDTSGQPVHSTYIVLVDRTGTIRGYYNATDADAITRLLADVAHLRREQPAGS